LVQELRDRGTLTLPLVMHTIDIEPKLSLKITLDQAIGLNFAASISGAVGPRAPLDDINRYMDDIVRRESSMSDTIPGTERIRVPAYIGEQGLELSQGKPMPAIAFLLRDIPRTNTAYWENAFQNVMARDQLAPGDWGRLNKKGQARAAILTIVNLTQALDYISDTVDRSGNIEGIEEFSSGLDTGKGSDCEDDAMAIMQTHNALLSHQFGPNDRSELREIQQIARQYVPVMSLDAVRGAAVGDEEAHVGAHMNINYVPSWLVKQWLGSKQAATVPFEPEETWTRELPFMIAEGTGVYEPLGYEDDYQAAKAYVYKARSLASFRKPIDHKIGETTPFFIGSLTGMTDYWLRRGSRRGGLIYVTKNKGRGAYYADMINQQDQIKLELHPELPQNVFQYMKICTSIGIPPLPLTLTQQQQQQTTNKHLDYIVANGISQRQKQQPPGAVTVRVPVLIRPHQITSAQAEHIAAEFRSLGAVSKLEYKLERYTDDIYGYRVFATVQLSKSKK
jgi:hypothetical protein